MISCLILASQSYIELCAFKSGLPEYDFGTGGTPYGIPLYYDHHNGPAVPLAMKINPGDEFRLVAEKEKGNPVLVYERVGPTMA